MGHLTTRREGRGLARGRRKSDGKKEIRLTPLRKMKRQSKPKWKKGVASRGGKEKKKDHKGPQLHCDGKGKDFTMDTGSKSPLITSDNFQEETRESLSLPHLIMRFFPVVSQCNYFYRKHLTSSCIHK